MPQPPQIEVLSELIGVLVECAEPRSRERILVHTLRERGWAQAVALFHSLHKHADDSAWIESLSQGPADLLPDGDVVRAVYRGELPEELPLNKRLIFASNAHCRSALVLGGFNGEEHELDLLEATFQVISSISQIDDDPDSSDPNLLDLLHGALPRSKDSGPIAISETHEMASLLNQVGGIEELMKGGLGPISEEDQAHFSEILDRECAKAADILGETLEQAASELARFGDTCVAARVDHLCEQGSWVLSQRNIELQVHSAPAARVFTLPISSGAVDALLEEALGRLFERLRRLRGGGGRIDIELERVDTRRLGLRVWLQLKRGQDKRVEPLAPLPEELLADACASVVPRPHGEPGALLELLFERPAGSPN
jgi:hypothetical protein